MTDTYFNSNFTHSLSIYGSPMFGKDHEVCKVLVGGDQIVVDAKRRTLVIGRYTSLCPPSSHRSAGRHVLRDRRRRAHPRRHHAPPELHAQVRARARARAMHAPPHGDLHDARPRAAGPSQPPHRHGGRPTAVPTEVSAPTDSSTDRGERTDRQQYRQR